ncbi:DUF7521 family protein [Halogeometricum luteum]|uniref:DUF7521 family protein n=1 Tax=Halogeometricum luteum TaxID=2950537 RepID=UPI003CCCBEF5
MVLLQSDLRSLPPRYIVLFVAFGLVVAMGLFIVFQAYQGYRRNSSRRMMFLAIGLAFITVVSPLSTAFVASFGFPFGSSWDVYQYYLPLMNAVLQILGLACIIYSLSIHSNS